MFINAGFAIKVEWKNVFKFVVQIFYNMGGIKSIVRQNIWVSANVTDFKMWNIVQIGTLRLSKYEKFKYLEKSKSKNMYLKFIITMLDHSWHPCLEISLLLLSWFPIKSDFAPECNQFGCGKLCWVHHHKPLCLQSENSSTLSPVICCPVNIFLIYCINDFLSLGLKCFHFVVIIVCT